jgi:predicted mannosyl-3-phosphoglycerate phosphatase (HAD superfamily)
MRVVVPVVDVLGSTVTGLPGADVRHSYGSCECAPVVLRDVEVCLCTSKSVAEIEA